MGFMVGDGLSISISIKRDALLITRRLCCYIASNDSDGCDWCDSFFCIKKRVCLRGEVDE